MKFEWPWQRKKRKEQERLAAFRQISYNFEPLPIYPEADPTSPLHPSNPLYPLNVTPTTTEETKHIEPTVLPFNPVKWDDTPVERVSAPTEERVHTYSAPEETRTTTSDSYSSSDSSSSSTSSDTSSY